LGGGGSHIHPDSEAPVPLDTGSSEETRPAEVDS
jgi:hypothetical protein